jgi:hypothetical protein
VSSDSAAPPAGASTDDSLAWLEARAKGARVVRLDAPRADADGRIVFSPESAARKEGPGTGPGYIHYVPSLRVGAGEELVMGQPGGRPLKVATALLDVADGGRVVMETHVELLARSVVLGVDSPIVLVGADGGPGGDGGDGPGGGYRPGTPGGGGKPGDYGKPGPGGTFYFGEITGTLNVVAGGGSGGKGGNGGKGGDSGFTEDGFHGWDGAPGGDAGDGGNTGDGGTVLIAYGTLGAGAAIQLTAHTAAPGSPGLPGQPGAPGPRSGGGQCNPGNPGKVGKPGTLGEATVFLVRQGL